MVAGMELAREIASKSPLADVVVRELKPGAGVAGPRGPGGGAARAVELIYHPVGTCRMSDESRRRRRRLELRVHGLEGLRVVDASILPVIPGGNTNAPTIMVAEKASDLIRGRVTAAPHTVPGR